MSSSANVVVQYLGNLEQISARTRVGESVQLYIPLHIFDLNIVV